MIIINLSLNENDIEKDVYHFLLRHEEKDLFEKINSYESEYLFFENNLIVN